MSYSLLESRIRSEAILEGPARARELLRELHALEEQAAQEQLSGGAIPTPSLASNHIDDEIEYLTELANLAPKDCALGAEVAAIHNACASTRFKPKSEPRQPQQPQQQQQLQQQQDAQLPPPVQSTVYKPPPTDSVGAVATFLGLGRDEVRLRAARHELIFDLAQARSLTATPLGEDRLLAVRSQALVRSWGVQDDERAVDPEHILLLELNKDVASLVDACRDLASLVESTNEPLEQAAVNMERAADTTSTAVDMLAEANDDKKQIGRVVPPMIAALAGLVIPVCPMSAAAVGGTLAVKALLATTLATGTIMTQRKLESWQEKAWQMMQEQLPTAHEPLSPDEHQQMIAQGDLAEARLLDATAAVGWKRMIVCPRAGLASFLAGCRFDIFYRESGFRDRGTRMNGFAYRTSFEVPLDAREAFLLAERTHIDNTLDPHARICWTCPVRRVTGKEVPTTTTVRFAVSMNRDFFLVSRSGELSEDPKSVANPRPARCFGIALASVPENLLGGRGLPKPSGAFEHGYFYGGGVMIEPVLQSDVDASPRCRVVVAADVDPSVKQFPDVAIDMVVRRHVLSMARRLLDEFNARGSSE